MATPDPNGASNEQQLQAAAREQLEESLHQFQELLGDVGPFLQQTGSQGTTGTPAQTTTTRPPESGQQTLTTTPSRKEGDTLHDEVAAVKAELSSKDRKIAQLQLQMDMLLRREQQKELRADSVMGNFADRVAVKAPIALHNVTAHTTTTSASSPVQDMDDQQLATQITILIESSASKDIRINDLEKYVTELENETQLHSQNFQLHISQLQSELRTKDVAINDLRMRSQMQVMQAPSEDARAILNKVMEISAARNSRLSHLQALLEQQEAFNDDTSSVGTMLTPTTRDGEYLEVGELQGQVKSLTEICEEKDAKIQELVLCLEQFEEEVQKSVAQLTMSPVVPSSVPNDAIAPNTLANLQEQIHELTSELFAKDKAISALVTEKTRNDGVMFQRWEEHTHNLIRELKQKDDAIQHLRHQLDTHGFQAEQKRIQEHLEILASESANKDAKISQLMQRIEQQDQIMSQQMNALMKVQMDRHLWEQGGGNDMATRLQEQVQNLTQECGEKEARISSLMQACAQAEAHLNSQISSLSTQCDEKEHRVSELLKKLGEQTITNHQMGTQIQLLEAEIHQKERNANQSEDALMHGDSEKVAGLLKRIAEQEQSYHQVQTEKTQLLVDLEASHGKLQQLEQQLLASSQTPQEHDRDATIEKQPDESKQEIEDLKHQLENKQKEMQEVIKQGLEIKKQIQDESKEDLEDMKKQLKMANDKLNEADEDNREAFDELQQEMETKQQEADQKIKEIEEQLTQSQQSATESNNNVVSLQQKISDSIAQLDQVKLTIAAKDKEIEELKAELSKPASIDTNTKDLEEQKAQLEQQLRQSMEFVLMKDKEIDRMRVQQQQREAEFEARLRDATQAAALPRVSNVNEEAIQKLEAYNTQLQGESNEWKLKYDQSLRCVQERDNEIQRLSIALADLQQQLETSRENNRTPTQQRVQPATPKRQSPVQQKWVSDADAYNQQELHRRQQLALDAKERRQQDNATSVQRPDSRIGTPPPGSDVYSHVGGPGGRSSVSSSSACVTPVTVSNELHVAEGLTQQEKEDIADIDLTDTDLQQAATRIQASFRGAAVRKKSPKPEAPIQAQTQPSPVLASGSMSNTPTPTPMTAVVQRPPSTSPPVDRQSQQPTPVTLAADSLLSSQSASTTPQHQHITTSQSMPVGNAHASLIPPPPTSEAVAAVINERRSQTMQNIPQTHHQSQNAQHVQQQVQAQQLAAQQQYASLQQQQAQTLAQIQQAQREVASTQQQQQQQQPQGIAPATVQPMHEGGPIVATQEGFMQPVHHVITTPPLNLPGGGVPQQQQQQPQTQLLATNPVHPHSGSVISNTSNISSATSSTSCSSSSSSSGATTTTPVGGQSSIAQQGGDYRAVQQSNDDTELVHAVTELQSSNTIKDKQIDQLNKQLQLLQTQAQSTQLWQDQLQTYKAILDMYFDKSNPQAMPSSFQASPPRSPAQQPSPRLMSSPPQMHYHGSPTPFMDHVPHHEPGSVVPFVGSPTMQKGPPTTRPPGSTIVSTTRTTNTTIQTRPTSPLPMPPMPQAHIPAHPPPRAAPQHSTPTSRYPRLGASPVRVTPMRATPMPPIPMDSPFGPTASTITFGRASPTLSAQPSSPWSHLRTSPPHRETDKSGYTKISVGLGRTSMATPSRLGQPIEPPVLGTTKSFLTGFSTPAGQTTSGNAMELWSNPSIPGTPVSLEGSTLSSIHARTSSITIQQGRMPSRPHASPLSTRTVPFIGFQPQHASPPRPMVTEPP